MVETRPLFINLYSIIFILGDSSTIQFPVQCQLRCPPVMTHIQQLSPTIGMIF